MAARRRAGEGTVYRRKDGLWAGQVRLSTGRRTFASKSKTAVLDKIGEAVKLDRQGIPVPGASLTVASFLDDWLDDRKDKMRQTAHESCERHVRLHIKPALGSKPLVQITPQDVRKMESGMLRAEKAAQTVRNVHWTLHGALDDAVKWGVVLAGAAARGFHRRTRLARLDPLTCKQFAAAAAPPRLTGPLRVSWPPAAISYSAYGGGS